MIRKSINDSFLSLSKPFIVPNIFYRTCTRSLCVTFFSRCLYQSLFEHTQISNHISIIAHISKNISIIAQISKHISIIAQLSKHISIIDQISKHISIIAQIPKHISIIQSNIWQRNKVCHVIVKY